MDILKYLPKKNASQLFDDLPKGEYTYDLDPATAIFGTGLSEDYEANSVRNNPIVDTIAKAAMAQPAYASSRPVSAIDAITTAADTGFHDYTPDEINNPVSIPSVLQDAAATAIAIPYTAASTGVSAANLLTGGLLDNAVTAMNEGQQALQQSFGSDELNRQLDNINAVQQEKESNLFDVLVAAANNPRALAYDAIRNLGTMALPTGAALGAGKLAQSAPALAKYVPALGKVAPWMASHASGIGFGASQAANALMNASDTFSDDEMMKQSLGERYAGAGISGLISLIAGGLTEGGAEGQIARRLLNGPGQAANGFRDYAKNLGKSAAKEGAQEFIEESGNYLGNLFGTNGEASFNEMSKRGGYGGLLGTLTGGASHVGTNIGAQQQTQAAAEKNVIQQVLSELAKIRQQNEQKVQTRQVQGQYVEPQEVNLPAGLFEKTQSPVQIPENLSTRSAEPVAGSPETLTQVQTEPVEKKQEPVAETVKPVAEPEQNVSDNPLDVIIANGGIQREVLTKDLGWTDEEISKLPEGVVSDDGMTLLPARRALKQAGLDTDVNAILDATSRPPEMDFAEAENELLSQENAQPQQEPAITTKQEKQGNENAKNDVSLPETNEQENAVSLPETSEQIETDKSFVPASIDDISKERAYQAYYWSSMSPEKRGEAFRTDYADTVNNIYDELKKQVQSPEQEAILNDEMNRFKKGYLQRSLKLLNATSNTASPMVTGPAKFNVRRNNKMLDRKYSALEELTAFSDKAKAAILKKIRTGTPQEITSENEWRDLKRELDATHMKENLFGRIETLARNGKVELLGKALEHIKNKNVFTDRHRIWKLPELAKKTADALATKSAYQGAEIVSVPADNRLRILFDARPDQDVITDLKKSGWKWSPANNAWQRQLTPTAMSSAKNILDRHFEKLNSQETEQGIALFSRSERAETTTDAGHGDNAAATDHIGIEEIQRIADELAKEYRNAPELVVVEKASDLPFDAPDDAKGAYRSGRCYLVSGNIATAEDAKSTFAHEVIGHYGLNGFFGDRLASELDSILVHNKNVQESARKWIKDNLDLIRDVREKTNGKWTDEQFRLWRKRRAIEEALTDMAEKGQKVTGVKKLVYAIQKLLRAIGLGNLANKLESRTDAEALMALHKAELFVRSGKNVNAATAVDVYAKFSLSAMKSVEANIARGKEAMNRALLDKTTVHRAMFRNGLGWVDFVWGSTGRTTDNGRTRGAMGIAHVLEARQRKDGFSRSEAVQLLHDIVEVIAKGKEFSRSEIGRSTRVGLETQGHVTWLTKYSGSNAWVVTGYEKTPDGKSAGRATDLPTDAIASRTRNDTGAGVGEDNIPQDPESIAFSRKNAFSGEDINRPDSAIADRIHQAMKKVDEETVNTRRNIEDKYIDLKLVQRAIEESGGVIPERQDAYLHVRQYVRRTSDQLKRFQNNGVKPIINALNESGVTLKEANDWLYARHVWLDKVNDRLKNLPANRDKPNNEALSGMSDADAKAILKKHANNEKLQELGKLVDRMTKFTRSRMVDGQLVPKGMVELWEKTYSHYVPLMRDEEKGGIRKSRGFVVRGQESKQRTGSERRAANILENILAQAQSTIIRAEKAEAARALYRLVKAFPNPDLWKVRKNKKEPVINPETGLMEWKVDKLHREKDHVLIVKLHGEEHLIEFNENNPGAVEIAKALKNLDAPQIPQAIQLVGEATRYIGRWLTTRNILFASRNFLRDVQHALFNLSDTPISGKEGQVLKNMLPAMRGYMQATLNREGEHGGKYADYAREFMEAGGETGFIRSMESIDDYRADLERQIKEMNQENYDPRKWWRTTWEAVENANNVIENSTRLAVYIVARENGISVKKAAMIAGEITVDFNKRGKWSGWMNSLWMFLNANIQGHARMLAALKHSKKARILAASLVGAGFVMSFAARAMLGKDDETGQDIWDEISDFDKERNRIIPIPWKGGKEPFIRVPIAQGLPVLPNVGRTLEEMIFSSKKQNPIEKMVRLALLTVDAFNPFGAWLARSVYCPICGETHYPDCRKQILYRFASASR
ncbi:LPD38 domain-containing protein [Oxalobacter paraformigenes]|uniref:Phage-Barnase-EndoU-ColicinE5/D-RelE-like nuclease domain-containing protein n=1 Tax=Oxalobacter paraformigenes TaxID=556268 RepID=C3X188_9BURK|nr:LPD38 domain-containing protein [Oxalobacter paraformigenes]EEO26974.2 hypothetical protein OFAG_00127 [Oxalobacter paraformigenes]